MTNNIEPNASTTLEATLVREKEVLSFKIQTLQEAIAAVNRLNAEVDYHKGRVSALADVIRELRETGD